MYITVTKTNEKLLKNFTNKSINYSISLQCSTVHRLFLQMLPQCKLQEKYSLESTDPRESEIRAHLRP